MKMSRFEFDGEKYKQASRHQKEWGNQLISDLNLNGNEEILDLGCGDGALTAQLSLLVPNGRVLGIDASVGMIETAKKHKRDNLEFMCMDINNINFANEFDIIFSNATLHWIKNHDNLLKGCFNALKNSGVIRWNFAGDGNCSNFYEVVKAVMAEDNYKQYFVNFDWPWFMPTKAEYEVILSKTGFSKAQIKFENADRYFADCGEMIKWIDQPSIVPFIKVLPDEIKNTFRNSVVDKMIKATRQPDRRCFETFRRIDIKAVK